MSQKSRVGIVGSLMLLSAILPNGGAMAEPFITGVGRTGYLARAISADGSTVIGSANMRWTLSQGVFGIAGNFPARYANSSHRDVSADGTFVVGYAIDTVEIWNESMGYRLSTAGTVDLIGSLPGLPNQSTAFAISDDGSKVVGLALGSGPTAGYIWDIDSGITVIHGSIPSSFADTRVISGDGKSVFGGSASATGSFSVTVRWTQATGSVETSNLPESPQSTCGPEDASYDGLAFVGYCNLPSGWVAVIWTAAGGMVNLGDLPGGSVHGIAKGISADGTRVVGSGRIANDEDRAFVWDATSGMRAVEQVLSDSGVDLTGWTLTEAIGISADGLKITGNGINPNGDPEIWYAELPEIPEAEVASVPALSPFAIAVLAGALAITPLRRLRAHRV